MRNAEHSDVRVSVTRGWGPQIFGEAREGSTAAVRAARKDCEDEKIYVMAAGLVMIEYLRKMIDDPEHPNDFLHNRTNEMGGLNWRYTVRTTTVGETLFLLRNCSGFPEICRRLK